MRDRLLIIWGIYVAIRTMGYALDIYNLFFALPHWFANYLQNEPDAAKATSRFREHLQALILVVYWLLHRHWSQQQTGLLFLYLAWSVTIAPQIVLTLNGAIDPSIPADCAMLAIAQAVIIPVGWWLHVLSWSVPLLYYVGVNGVLVTVYQGQSIYNNGLTISVFICCICVWAVYMQERVFWAEFEHRRRLEMFLLAVASDLKMPTVATSIVLDNLLDSLDRELWVDKSLLSGLLQSSDRQLASIDALLAIHQSEIKGIALHCNKLSLKPIVENVLSDLAPVLSQHQIICINRIRSDLPQIYADAMQLWRVYSSLIHNAIASNRAGVQLTLDADVRDCQWRLKMRRSRTKIQLLYCQIVAPYLSQNCSNSDLNLHLCQQIIAAHGGELGVNNSANSTTFWFTLPLHVHSSARH